MQFKQTYQVNNNSNPYYFIDGKRVSEEKFEDMKAICRIKGMRYNSSLLYTQGNRYHACFCYD